MEPSSSDKDSQLLKVEKSNTKITLRHLMTHTSGTCYEHQGFPQIQAWKKENPDVPRVQSSITGSWSCPLIFEPGTHWKYSPGLDWAGLLVERLSPKKLTLGQYMQENVFGKLGVGKSTTFRLYSPEAKAAKIEERLLVNTERQKNGSFIEKKYGIPEDVERDFGGGGLYSTVGDFTAVLADLVAPEPEILKKETIEKYLFSPCIPSDSPAIIDLINARTGMTLDVGSSADAAGVNHSLGGMLWTKDSPVHRKGTLEWGGLPNLKWMVNREQGVAAMYASQVTPPHDPESKALVTRFFQEVWKNFD